MNILALSDLYIPSEVMRQALAALNPAKVSVVEWPNRSITELHHRIREIERLGPEAVAPPDGMRPYLADAELIVTHMCPVNAAMIADAPKLRWIGVCRSACENVDVPSANARGIRVLDVPARNAVAVAEYTIGLIIAERRNIARAHHALFSGRWEKIFPNEGHPTELRGKTVGIIGFGAIGKEVARRLNPFEVRILAHDPLQSSDVFAAHEVEPVLLATLLRESDVVTLHARRGAADPPLIGSAELGLMKPGAYLVNTARASLVDVNALAAALRERRLAGAAIDVFLHEPLESDSPLRKLDNLTLTPHLAGSTVEAFHGAPRLLVERIKRQLEANGV